MHRFLLLLISFFLMTSVFAKSPHGEGFKIDCGACHNTINWEQLTPRHFNHNKTRFPLIGQHKSQECKVCHPTLEFSKANMQCYECHMDMHEGTVGKDCDRCHTPKSWIVSNVKQIHQQAGFTLAGTHAITDCYRCHKSASQLRFDNIRTDCYSCHKANYDATTHRADGFGTDCFPCHNMTGSDWSYSGKGFVHGTFPLTGAHNINCILCHKTGEYKTVLSSACKTCHLDKYNATTSPVHRTTGFSQECQTCHTTTSWTSFNHSAYFPITSGNHNVSCASCHTNTANYAIFTCVTASCHRNAHNQSRGSAGCYQCHPTGRSGG